MSQRDALAGMDADLHAAFLDAGLADLGLYWPPGALLDAPGMPARVYVDRDTQTLGDVRQVRAGRVEVAYVLAPGLNPEQGGLLLVDGERFENASLLSDNGSTSRWLVRRARA